MFGLGRKWPRRTAQIAAVGMLAASGSMFVASTALAAPVPAGGNNGTVQINGQDIKNGNDPHLSCPVVVNWSGFDVPVAPKTNDYTVSFAGVAPTGGTINTIAPSDPTSGSFTTSTNTATYYLSSPDAKANHKGEIHVNVTVSTTSASHTDTKSKTVWLQSCTVAPPANTVTVTGACDTSAHVFSWTVVTDPVDTVSGTWTATAGGASTAWTAASGSTFTTGLVNDINVALTTAGWTLTATHVTAAGHPACTAANNQVSVSGTCNGANNGYSWQLSTTPATQGIGGTFAPSGGATTAFTTNANGVATFATDVQHSSLDWAVTTAGWPSHGASSGTVGAAALCSVNQPQPGQVSVSGHCNTTTQGYDWTVTTAPTAAGVDGTWSANGGAASSWSTDPTGHATFSSGVGENTIGLTVTTNNWNISPTATTTACVTPGQAAAAVDEANHCKSGMNLTLSNMNGTADTTFTVTDPDGNTQQVDVRAGQLKKLSFPVTEDTTGTLSVSAPGLAKQTFTYDKNCASVLGIKHTRKPHTPTHKPVVEGEHAQLPFTGFDTHRYLVDGAALFFFGAVLCMLGARRKNEDCIY